MAVRYQFFILFDDIAVGPWLDEISCERFARRAEPIVEKVFGIASIPSTLHRVEWWSGRYEDVPSFVIRNGLLDMYEWDEGAGEVRPYEEVFGIECFITGTEDHSRLVECLEHPELPVILEQSPRRPRSEVIGEWLINQT